MRDNSRKLTVMYCEDVRLELTGQTSLIGIFNGTLLAQSFPLTLPKFAVSVEIGTPFEEQLRSLRFELTTDAGDQLLAMDFPKEVLQQQKSAVSQADLEGMEEKMVGFRTQFFLTPLVLQQPTIIRSKIITENGEVRGAALKVGQGNPVFPTMQPLGQ
jgi:hypothetical protein